MTSGKGRDEPTPEPSDASPSHLAALLERARRSTRMDAERFVVASGLQDRFPGIRGSLARLLSLLPAGGARIGDMAPVAGTTKQALGPLFDELEAGGFVESRRDPSDGRARILVRTDIGDEVVKASTELWEHLADGYAAEIGPQRWAAFVEVLELLGSRNLEVQRRQE